MAERIFLAANNGDVGGGEQMLLRTAEAARALGHDVTVVAPRDPGDVIRAAQALGMATYEISGDGRPGYLRELRRWDRQRKGLLWCQGLVPSLATAGHRRRLVHLHQKPQNRAQRVALGVARLGAIRVLVPSYTMSGEIHGARALPNWTADLPVLARPASSDTLRIGFLGRLSTDKGLDVLAEAVGRVGERGRVLDLMIAGDGRWVSERQRMQAANAVTKLGDHAVRLGHVPPENLFSDVDVVAFPSRWSEPFGLVVAEAMAAGVPFIVSDAGALPEVAGREHPWVTPAGDVEALANMIERVASAEPTEVEAVTRAARARWESEYSPAAGRERVRRLLEEVGVK